MYDSMFVHDSSSYNRKGIEKFVRLCYDRPT